MQRVHCLQHSSRVTPDGVLDWAASRGVELDVRRVDLGELPAVEEVERVVVLGGEMNADQADQHPWLHDELAWLVALLERDAARVLGICLGSQLLAAALGGTVGRCEDGPEIGWHRAELTEAGARHPALAQLPREFEAFEWHGDSWSLPPGAELAIAGPGCAAQAFTHGERIVAVQFHPEFTQAHVRDLARTTTDDLDAGGLVQRPSEFLPADERFAALARVRDALLDGALQVMLGR